MPDISLPEVRLKDKLPEGLRDMTVDDIQKALPEMRLPRFDVPHFDVPRLDVAGRELARDAHKAARQADRTARKAQRAAAREAGRAVRVVENALPRRRGPNPVPIAILAMLGGAVVGWLLATNPATGPRITAWFDDLRLRLAQWRGGGTTGDEWETTGNQAYPDPLASSIASEPYSGTLPASETIATGTATGAGITSPATGTEDETATGDPAVVGSVDGVSSERF